MSPEEIILLYVEKLEGSSLMDDMLGEAELSTLREEREHKSGCPVLITIAERKRTNV